MAESEGGDSAGQIFVLTVICEWEILHLERNAQHRKIFTGAFGSGNSNVKRFVFGVALKRTMAMCEGSRYHCALKIVVR